MADKYIPKSFEGKLIDQWDKDQIYNTPDVIKDAAKQSKKYVLDMFPYPSGDGLHVGHIRLYIATDILARYFRMKGYNVLHPMGWDAFGLPAENAAIKAKKNPMDIVPKNIANFKRQMKLLGLSYDWEREFATTDPSYYRWTQWLFIQFFKLGLLVKKDTNVYYCPFCKTGLAEEEVMANGTHERCGYKITRKKLPQWFFRITTYADRLLEDLNELDWPQGILQQQRNWIGKKEGIDILYKVDNTSEEITCFTTRPDTNFGATFIVLAPEHPFVKKIVDGKIAANKATNVEEINKYLAEALGKTDLERISEGRKKTGLATGFYAINQLNKTKLPIWISDFVLADFGTGAVVAVPGHDLRDFEFAKQFNLPIIRVVVGLDDDKSAITTKEQVQEQEGKMINSDFLNGLDIHNAIKKMMDYLVKKNWGKKTVSYHLRDWIFSRQRYWGEPIPVVFCQHCADNKISFWDTKQYQKESSKYKDYHNTTKIHPIKGNLYGWFPIAEKELPLKLPKVKSYEPSPKDESLLAQVKDWVEAVCPNCGKPAKRETDTMPNWAGSCWYFLRFADPKNDNQAWSRASIQKWLPVDWYLGGAEHAVLHLLYSRFWVKILYDLKLLPFKEPFRKLNNVGMVLGLDHQKMSKSVGNVITPDEIVAEYGADSLRVHEMFMAPFSQEISWSTKNLQGPYRFMQTIWQTYTSSDKITNKDEEEDKRLVVELQGLIKTIEDDITNVKFNTAVSSMMEFINAWQKPNVKLSKTNAIAFLKLFAPFAPFMVEELWSSVLANKNSIHLSDWPKASKQTVKKEQIKMPVQVNGKLRGIIIFSEKESSQDEVVRKALELDSVKKHLTDKKYEVIYKKEKILNFVTK